MRRAGLPQRGSAQVAGYSPIWPPTRLPGCVAWLDCQETLTQAGTVTSIRNMASGVDWTEAVAPPTYDATGINGRPCMVGNATDMKIMSTEAAAVAPLIGVSRPWTAIVVASQGIGNSGTFFGYGSSANNIVRGNMVGAGSGFFSGSLVDDTAAVNLTLTDPYLIRDHPACVLTTVCYGASLQHYVNTHWRGDPMPANTGQMTPNRLGLLCRPRQTPDGFHPGSLGAALFYNHALSSSEVRGLASALMARWGITG